MKREFISPLLCMFGSLSLVVLISVIMLNVMNKQRAEAIQQSTQGYTYIDYYSGREVDPEMIELSSYKYKVDDQNKTVYIAEHQRKQHSSFSHMIPIIIPMVVAFFVVWTGARKGKT